MEIRHTEIARSPGVGEERSRQLERESLHRLRSILTTAGERRPRRVSLPALDRSENTSV